MSIRTIIGIIGVAAVVQLVFTASIGNNICTCTREYFPICGSDNSTYSNNCLFECEKERNSSLEISFYGECDDGFHSLPIEDNFCACAKDFNPVCGSDDQTYSNECLLNCHKLKRKNLRLKHRGECGNEIIIQDELPIECVCSRAYFPLCGSDDKTYSNECTLNCARKSNENLSIQFQGECSDVHILPIIINDCMCPAIYIPLCASDGNTYSSKCHLQCEQRHKIGLKIKHFGACNDS